MTGTPPPPPSPTAHPSRQPPGSTPAHGRADVADEQLVVRIHPWVDPLVDESGHDPRSTYVERFWLGVLGPTATWLLRRLVNGLEKAPDGYALDLRTTAAAMGMSYSSRRSSAFTKALQRCTMFGLAHQTSDGFAVRRRIPQVAHRHLQRMPDALRDEHDRWVRASVSLDELSRAHQLALAMLEVGDDPDAIEHQLVALGVTDPTAADVADNARRLAADGRRDVIT